MPCLELRKRFFLRVLEEDSGLTLNDHIVWNDIDLASPEQTIHHVIIVFPESQQILVSFIILRETVDVIRIASPYTVSVDGKRYTTLKEAVAAADPDSPKEKSIYPKGIAKLLAKGLEIFAKKDAEELEKRKKEQELEYKEQLKMRISYIAGILAKADPDWVPELNDYIEWPDSFEELTQDTVLLTLKLPECTPIVITLMMQVARVNLGVKNLDCTTYAKKVPTLAESIAQAHRLFKPLLLKK